MTAYDDLFVRDTWTDNGNFPVTDTFVSASPDILPRAAQPWTPAQVASKYNDQTFVGLDIAHGNVNNIYVRAENAGTVQRSGQLYLRWSPANLLINTSAWRRNFIPNQNGTPQPSYASLPQTLGGVVVAGDQPFGFIPTTTMPDHFCLIATITNSHGDPTPPADFTSFQAFVDWVRNNPNVSWRNVNQVSSLPVQGWTQSLSFQNVTLGNQMYAFKCSYSGVPAGSLLRVWTLPNPAAGFYGFDTTPVSVGGSGTLLPGCNFPANYMARIYASCNFPGSPTTPPPGTTISLQSNGWTAGFDGYEYFEEFSAPAADFGIDMREFGLPAAGYFTPIISCTALFGSS